MTRVELDVRIRVGEGAWASIAEGEVPGESLPEIFHRAAVELRELADVLDAEFDANFAATTPVIETEERRASMRGLIERLTRDG